MYELRGYGIEDFIAACKILKESHPEMYEEFYLILRRQPIHISEADLEYLKGEPAPLKITIPVIIEVNKE